MHDDDTRERPSRKAALLQPLSVSIADAAILTGESRWTVNNKLRTGEYEGVKSGKRTLVLYASLREHILNLPKATYAPLVERERTNGWNRGEENRQSPPTKRKKKAMATV